MEFPGLPGIVFPPSGVIRWEAMNDLAQSMREIQVELHPVRPGLERVSMFLHRNGLHGPERLQERLNGPEPFLPAKGRDGSIRLLAKAGIAVVDCVEEPDELVSLRELLPSPASVRIALRDGASLEGRLLLLLPGEHQRVLDFLVQPERFFLLSRTRGASFVNKDWIDHVAPAPETR